VELGLIEDPPSAGASLAAVVRRAKLTPQDGRGDGVSRRRTGRDDQLTADDLAVDMLGQGEEIGVRGWPRVRPKLAHGSQDNTAAKAFRLEFVVALGVPLFVWMRSRWTFYRPEAFRCLRRPSASSNVMVPAKSIMPPKRIKRLVIIFHLPRQSPHSR
jgi:hypothetical protein